MTVHSFLITCYELCCGPPLLFRHLCLIQQYSGLFAYQVEVICQSVEWVWLLTVLSCGLCPVMGNRNINYVVDHCCWTAFDIYVLFSSTVAYLHIKLK